MISSLEITVYIVISFLYVLYFKIYEKWQAFNEFLNSN